MVTVADAGPAQASPALTKHDMAREIACCTPGVGRQWARYFATRYAVTSDEHNRSGSRDGTALIPAYKYILDKCQAFEEGVDNHGEKTRQMTISWTTASNHLGRTMFGHNAAGFITSRKEKVVDDGGSRSTTFSLVGKMRFIYEHLPAWMRDARPIDFQHLRIDSTKTRSYVVGEGATGEGGRSGTFGRATVDEAAFMPGVGWYRAIRSACPVGLGLDSTPNGKGGIFARVKFETPGRFRFLRYHWTRHPILAAGLYYDDRNRPRSPWYDDKTDGLTADEIAREFDISYEHSAAGLVWPEFDEDRHVTWDCVIDHDLPLYGGMDFGMGAATTVVLFQMHGQEVWILGAYEAWNQDVDDHAPAIWSLIQRIGYRGSIQDVRIFGDPAGRAREMTNKNSTVIRAYQAKGFVGLTTAPMRSKKDRVRLVRRKFVRNHMFLHPKHALILRKRLPDFKYKTDDAGTVFDDVIANNESVHLADALQYGVSGVCRIDEEFATQLDQPAEVDLLVPVHTRTDGSEVPVEIVMPGLGTFAPPLSTRY